MILPLVQIPVRQPTCCSFTGVHKQGLSRRFYVQEEGGTSTFDRPRAEYDLSTFVPLECPAGTLVLLHVSSVSCE